MAIAIIATIGLMVGFNALYVAAEFAAVSASRARLRRLAATDNRMAVLLLPIVENTRALDKYIATCQIGITASSLVLGAYGQSTLARALTPTLVGLGRLAQPVALSISVTVVLIVLTILQVVLGELFPKSVAVRYPEELALATVLPIKWSQLLFQPFIWLFNGSGNLILRMLRLDYQEGHAHAHSPEEIELLVADSFEGGLLDDEERQMLRNAFRWRQLIARQVMTPRTRLVTAPVESSVVDLMGTANERGFTRIPLYQGSVDNIIGFVHIKDLLRLHVEGRENLAEILREVVHLPETLPIAKVWEALSSRRQYMAVVFDEYGGTAGIITFEDLIEEIFGELQDEFDHETALISADQAGRIYLRADLLVTDVNEYLELSLPETEWDTLGGLVFGELGRLPVVGDEVRVGTPGTLIRVEAVEDRGISEVSLQLPVQVADSIGEWEVVERDDGNG